MDIISNYCYSGDKELKHYSVPENIAEIGVGAFSDCINLETVTLNRRLTRIKKELFSGCSALREINIPGSIESIGEWAFRNCTSLKELKLPESVKEICEEAFLGCKDLTIIAAENSYAAQFACRTGMPLKISGEGGPDDH